MLEQAELNALKTFAVAHGRGWKAELQKRWEHANCSPVLMGLRNKIGPSGLAAIRQADLPLPADHAGSILRRQRRSCPTWLRRLVLDREQHRLDPGASRAWFVKHVDVWTRWFHANNAEWKRSLESEGNQGRDQLYVLGEPLA